MNIIQISTGEQRIPVNMGGGIESHILRLSISLTTKGHNVTILDRKYSKDDPDIEYVGGVQIVRLKAKRMEKLPFYLRLTINEILFTLQAKKYIFKNVSDIVHVHNSISGFCLCMTGLSMRKKLFYTSHTSRRTEYLPLLTNLTDKVALLIENQLVKYANKTITHNSTIRDRIIAEAKVDPERVVTIPNLIDIENFYTNIDLGNIKKEFYPCDKFSVLFVGRICADKGVEYLIKAAKIIVQNYGYNKIIFVLVGPIEHFGATKRSSSYFQKISNMIDDYKIRLNIIITGPIANNDLKRLYAACNIFVLPSIREAMPNAVTLEAMASGIPTIITNVGGIPDQMKNNNCCIIVNPASGKELAEAIMYLINNPAERQKMGKCGREIAEAEFSSHKIAEKLIQVYEGK